MQFSQKAVPVTSKTVYYGADGTGRDSYIKTINGGLLTQDRLHELKPKRVISIDRMEFQKKQYHRTLPPKTENKLVNYHSDGSGRDYYVCINNGGRADTSYHWRNQVDFKFNHSLRQYPTIPHSFQRDMWRDSQQGFRNQKNQRQLSQERQIAVEQMNQTMRLSQPKINSRSRCHSFQERTNSHNRNNSSQNQQRNQENNHNNTFSPDQKELNNLSQTHNNFDTLKNDKEFIQKKLSSTLNNNFNTSNINKNYNSRKQNNNINNNIKKSLNDSFNISALRQTQNNLSFYK